LVKTEGENVYAKIDDEPFIVSVGKALWMRFRRSFAMAGLAIYNLKPEEITSFEVTKQGQAPVSLEREKDKWKLSKGDGNVIQLNAQSLVNTIANLHAVRWIGRQKPEHGFDKRVSF
jgi:hypothetical protein